MQSVLNGFAVWVAAVRALVLAASFVSGTDGFRLLLFGTGRTFLGPSSPPIVHIPHDNFISKRCPPPPINSCADPKFERGPSCAPDTPPSGEDVDPATGRLNSHFFMWVRVCVPRSRKRALFV